MNVQKCMATRIKYGSYSDINNNIHQAKATYDQHCDAVEASKLRFEKAPDEKTQEKLKKAWHADIAEMGNAKNNYILCVHIANSLKKRYHFEDMPLLMDDMQRLNEHRMAVTKKNMEDYVNLETTAHASISKHWSQMLTHINSIEESVDCSLFIKYQKALWTEPYDFAFEPSFLWKDSDQLVVDEQAKIYLSNKLAKTADKLQMVNEQIASKHKDRDGLQNLMDAYTRNPSTGDADQVSENVIETVRQITLLEIQKDRYSTTISVISSVIGDSSSGTRHTLVKTTFTIPTTCDYCQEKIWGIASKAYTCKTCGYNCHVKCEMKVPPYCSTSGGGSSAGQRTKVNRVASGPTPTSATSGSSSMNISPLAHTSSSSVNVSASGASGSTGRVIYGYEAMNDDELTVNEGDAIRVISSDDGSGWVRVECNRKEGLVPASYVEIHSGIASSAASSIRNTTQSLQVRAIYDYDAQNADELSMREGDVIDVTQQGTDGWWFGVLKGQTGQFPSTYVEPK